MSGGSRRSSSALKNNQAIDTTGDGKLDSIAVDTSGDGAADKLVKIQTMMDTTGDGIVDKVGVDTTGDGKVDKVVKIVHVTNEHYSLSATARADESCAFIPLFSTRQYVDVGIEPQTSR